MTTDYTPDTPLHEVRAWLREHLAEGAKCPCCTQLAKVYRRKITSPAAAGLIRLHRGYGTDWVHVPSVPGLSSLGGDLARLRYWGLVEEAEEARPDGGRAGWWRVTSLGASFVRGHTSIAKYALIYDGRLLYLDDNEQIFIRDALSTRFSYDDLMAGL